MSAQRDVFLGLGSNLGEREENLRRGREVLRAHGVALVQESALYLTEPVGGPRQGYFLNQVLRAETGHTPEELLAACLFAEQTLGRVRRERDGPRTLDVDVLLYGDRVLRSPQLTIPHPRLHLRRFVLVPLVEIAPSVRHPRLGRTAADLLAACPDRSQVEIHTPTHEAR